MELELRKEQFDTWEIGGDVLVTQDETTESIVPDYSPDIARIISAEGTVYLHSREIRDGRAIVTGSIRVTTLYIPDGEQTGMQSLGVMLPFSAECDDAVLSGCTWLSANVRVEQVEARLLNPRKIFIHCKLEGRLVGYRKSLLTYTSDVMETMGIQRRFTSQNAVVVTGVSEKDFAFTETMDLSPGREGAKEILSHRVSSNITETKVVGNKLLFKGMFTVQILYRTKEGNCRTTIGELPFSQILGIEVADEHTVAAVEMSLTGTDLQIDGDDAEGREFSITLYLHAFAVLQEERELHLLEDLYATDGVLQYEVMPLELTTLCRCVGRRQTVREVLEIGVVADEILAISVDCGNVGISREKENALLRTAAIVRVLYLDEGKVPLVTERSVEVSCQLELPEDCKVSAWAACMEEVQGNLAERGIEVRFPVDFRIEAVTRSKRLTIAALRKEPESEWTVCPSLVLRQMQPHESIWDLAKQFRSTIPAILQANQLTTEEEITTRQLLLIPRKKG